MRRPRSSWAQRSAQCGSWTSRTTLLARGRKPWRRTWRPHAPSSQRWAVAMICFGNKSKQNQNRAESTRPQLSEGGCSNDLCWKQTRIGTRQGGVHTLPALGCWVLLLSKYWLLVSLSVYGDSGVSLACWKLGSNSVPGRARMPGSADPPTKVKCRPVQMNRTGSGLGVAFTVGRLGATSSLRAMGHLNLRQSQITWFYARVPSTHARLHPCT